jgi:transposase
MAAKKQTFEMLPSNTRVEMIAVHKKTNQAYKKIIELQEFKTIKKDSRFNYHLYQLGFSKFKDVIER